MDSVFQRMVAKVKTGLAQNLFTEPMFEKELQRVCLTKWFLDLRDATIANDVEVDEFFAELDRKLQFRIPQLRTHRGGPSETGETVPKIAEFVKIPPPNRTPVDYVELLRQEIKRDREQDGNR